MENMGDLYCEVGMTVSDPTKLLKHLTVSIYIITFVLFVWSFCRFCFLLSHKHIHWIHCKIDNTQRWPHKQDIQDWVDYWWVKGGENTYLLSIVTRGVNRYRTNKTYQRVKEWCAGKWGWKCTRKLRRQMGKVKTLRNVHFNVTCSEFS